MFGARAHGNTSPLFFMGGDGIKVSTLSYVQHSRFLDLIQSRYLMNLGLHLGSTYQVERESGVTFLPRYSGGGFSRTNGVIGEVPRPSKLKQEVG